MSASSIRTLGYRPEHLLALVAQPAQLPHMERIVGSRHEVANYPAVSWVSDRVLGCAGLVRVEGRCIFWAAFSQTGPVAFLRIHRDVAMLISHCPDERMETYVDAGFEKGHRWMRLLGFMAEADIRMKNDSICVRYVRAV